MDMVNSGHCSMFDTCLEGKKMRTPVGQSARDIVKNTFLKGNRSRHLLLRMCG